MDIERIEYEIKEAVTGLLLPLQTKGEVDHGAFNRLHGLAQSLTSILKGQALVPKSLLNELYTAQLVLKSETGFHSSRKSDLEKMSHEIELCLSLILKDECTSDREPGIPRII